jgi:hypothetical protein
VTDEAGICKTRAVTHLKRDVTSLIAKTVKQLKIPGQTEMKFESVITEAELFKITAPPHCSVNYIKQERLTV